MRISPITHLVYSDLTSTLSFLAMRFLTSLTRYQPQKRACDEQHGWGLGNGTNDLDHRIVLAEDSSR